MIHKPAIDIVTLAAPRDLINTTIPSFFNHAIDRKDFYLRWVFHLDYIDILKDNMNETLETTRELASKFFDDSSLKYSLTNRGHSGSFKNCMDRVENDFFYLEDDKEIIKSFKIKDIVKDRGDHISLQGFSGKPGHTSASFWKYKIAEDIKKRWPKKNININTEDWCKSLCLRKNYVAGAQYRIARDIGMPDLNKYNIVRCRQDNGNPKYIKIPDNITYVTYIEDNRDKLAYRHNVKTWAWRLCIRSFPFQVYYNKNGLESKKIANSIAVESWKEFKLKINNINTHVIYINPGVMALRDAAFEIDYDNLIKTPKSIWDISGMPYKKFRLVNDKPLIEICK